MKRADRSMTRRDFVKGAAGTAAVVAVAGVGGTALWDRATRPDDPAAAWAAATGMDRIVLAASLAPSSHNTQPWKFRVGADKIDVLGDTTRTMGDADPRLRELHISLGCALESAAIAAAGAGTPVVVEQMPGPVGRHFATLRFDGQGSEQGGSHAALATAIPERRTNRGPYDEARPLAPTELKALGALAATGVRVVWLTAPEARARFSELSVKATEAHVADAAIQRDSHRWYRMDRSAAEKHRDGITVSGANLPVPISLMMGLFPPTPGSFDEGWATATRDTHCATAPAFGLLVVKDAGDRAAWVEVGRTYVRMQLAAALAGLATHPLSQALAIRDREIAGNRPGEFADGLAGLGGDGEVALAFRVGYPLREQPPSLRRPPVIVSA